MLFDMDKLHVLTYSSLNSYVTALVLVLVSVFEWVVEVFKEDGEIKQILKKENTILVTGILDEGIV